MARGHAQLFSTIWGDPDFLACTAAAQRCYFLLLSQPNLSYAGIVPLTIRRWSGLAPDTKPQQVVKALEELSDSRFVMIDEDTEEVWIRTFVRHDGVLKQPNLIRAMQKDFAAIQSGAIREAFAALYAEHIGGPFP